MNNVKEALRDDWFNAFASIGIPAISRDTAARILAVVYVHGNNEAFVLNEAFQRELNHIQQVYHVSGGETPDADLVELTNRYIADLEAYYEQHKDDTTASGAIFHSPKPDWAYRLFAERYGIDLLN